MSKRSLYIIIMFLGGVIAYLLLMPRGEVVAPKTTNVPARSDVPATTSAAIETAEALPVEPEADEIRRGTIEFTGTLIGFGDGKDEFMGSYKTALINDGIEVVPVDLRPLVGYDVTNIETDLGVTVGAPVTVHGRLEGDTFVVTDIE